MTEKRYTSRKLTKNELRDEVINGIRKKEYSRNIFKWLIKGIKDEVRK